MTAASNWIMNYLLNALWQVPLLFTVSWLLAFAVRRLGPLAEHRLWVTTLLAQCVLPACSAPELAAALSRLVHRGDTANGLVTVTLGSATPLATAFFAPLYVQIALLLYAAAVTLLAIRFVWRYVQVRALAASAYPISLPAGDTTFLNDALARFHIPQVRLATAPAVCTPITFGVRHPMLLLPGNFVHRTTCGQLRAALLHELAHISRRDYTKHLLYRALSLPIAAHPLLWSTLARIAVTREEVCDRIAAEQTGSPRHYGDMLLQLASLLTATRPSHAHAIGIFGANPLERRILMLHRNMPTVSRARRAAILAATAVLALTTGASAVALRLHIDPPLSAALAPGQPLKISSGVAAGNVLNKVQPKYPDEAKKAKIQGAVILDAIIGKDGTIENLTVVSGPEELRASALEAVHQWTYKPFLLNGQPTEVQTTITVTYSFSPDSQSPPPSGTSSSTEKTDGTKPPKLISQVAPVYPADARRNKIGGEVIVEAIVDAEGKVSETLALSGPMELHAAATDAVKQYVFTPATKNGLPVPVDLRISVKFEVF